MKGQAQALLDCLADLIAHGSLASAAAMMQVCPSARGQERSSRCYC